LNDDISRFAFANNLRDLTIWGYKSSELVGENVLSYLPVPGEYIGCGDLQELTGGKAWVTLNYTKIIMLTETRKAQKAT